MCDIYLKPPLKTAVCLFVTDALKYAVYRGRDRIITRGDLKPWGSWCHFDEASKLWFGFLN